MQLQTSHLDYNMPCKNPRNRDFSRVSSCCFSIPIIAEKQLPLSQSPRASIDQCVFQDVSSPETAIAGPEAVDLGFSTVTPQNRYTAC